MTVPQAAARLGLSPAGVRRRIERGDMKAELISPKLYLIDSEEVERWAALGKQKPGRKPKGEREQPSE
jgi:excisionase family DNA binding protein